MRVVQLNKIQEMLLLDVLALVALVADVSLAVPSAQGIMFPDQFENIEEEVKVIYH